MAGPTLRVRWLLLCALPALTFALAGPRPNPALSPQSPAAGPPVSPAPAPPGGFRPPPEVERLARAVIPGGDTLPLREARPETWPSTCLGLAPPGGICAQALIPGWVLTFDAPGGAPITVHVGGGVARTAPGP